MTLCEKQVCRMDETYHRLGRKLADLLDGSRCSLLELHAVDLSPC